MERADFLKVRATPSRSCLFSLLQNLICTAFTVAQNALWLFFVRQADSCQHLSCECWKLALCGKCLYCTRDSLSWLQSSHCSNCWHHEMSMMAPSVSPAVGISHELLQVISVWLFYFENHTVVSRLQSSGFKDKSCDEHDLVSFKTLCPACGEINTHFEVLLWFFCDA